MKVSHTNTEAKDLLARLAREAGKPLKAPRGSRRGKHREGFKVPRKEAE